MASVPLGNLDHSNGLIGKRPSIRNIVQKLLLIFGAGDGIRTHDPNLGKVRK